MTGGAAGRDAPTPAGQVLDMCSSTSDVTSCAEMLRQTAEVRLATQRIRDRYFVPHLQDGDLQGAVSMDDAVNEIVHSALLDAASACTAPRFTWFLAPPHAVGRAFQPGSRIIFDNPDRIYRFVPIDPKQRYVISGRITSGKKPAFLLFEAVQSMGAVGWGRPTQVLSLDGIDIAADGTFRITAGPVGAQGRNHLELPANADAILVRDTMLDWSAELPVQLSIKAEPHAVTEWRCRPVAAAIEKIDTYARMQFDFLDRTIPSEANQAGKVIERRTAGTKAWGVVAGGRFTLAPGEALSVTIDPLAARYIGFQLGDAWGRSISYYNVISSLNNGQARPNPNGSTTFIISAEYPGPHNWLDTDQVRSGLFAIRWDYLGVRDATDPTSAVRVSRVSVSELRDRFNAEQLIQGFFEREKQVHARFASFNERVLALAADSGP